MNSTLQCSSLTAKAKQTEDDDELEANFIDEETVDSKIADAQRSGRYDLIVQLPADFPASLTNQEDAVPCPVQLVTDGQNPMAVSMVTSVVKGFFAQKKASLAAEQLISLQLGGESFPADMAAVAKVIRRLVLCGLIHRCGCQLPKSDTLIRRKILRRSLKTILTVDGLSPMLMVSLR